jgi:predicted nucleic acid-binding protein
MAERIVLDAGPIIALTRAGALDAIGRLPFEFVSPREVGGELDEGIRRGHPVIAAPWIRFEALTAPLTPLAPLELGPGEAAVIQLAIEQRIAVVAIDEQKGRRAARAVGLTVTGTLGLLGKAKVHDIIPAVRPYIDKMQAASVWFDEDLVARFLAGLGE